MLRNAGLTNMSSMHGGMRAWKGFVAGGPPEAGMAYFPSASRPEELIALAWSLEEGSRRFYGALAGSLQDREAMALYQGLAGAEAGHEATLLTLYQEVTGDRLAAKIPDTLFSGIVPGEVMEGGMRVQQALEWTTGRSISDILDLTMALESYSYDLYLKMERTLTDGNARRVFLVLAGEEAKHLERMAALIEKRRTPDAP
jgi:sulfur-carrier protein adenylyltransferase/sulfurtransferase